MLYINKAVNLVQRHVAKNLQSQNPVSYSLAIVFASCMQDNWSVLVEVGIWGGMMYHVSYDSRNNETFLVLYKGFDKKVFPGEAGG